MPEHSNWVQRFRPRPAARVRLFCFPFAGGGASSFFTWTSSLPDWVEVCAVQYPGRENRWLEPPLISATALAVGILHGIEPLLDGVRFAFFGHSLGALIAYEAARLAQGARRPGPERLFLSGRRAPQFAPPPPVMHQLPDTVLIEQLGRLNGTPAEILQNKEMMQHLLPALRADFTADETYRFEPGAPLQSPLSIYGGQADPHVPEHELRAWAEHTTGPHTSYLFSGDHFYLKDAQSGLFEVLAQELDF